MVQFFKIWFSVSYERWLLKRFTFQISSESVKPFWFYDQICISELPIHYCVKLIMVARKFEKSSFNGDNDLTEWSVSMHEKIKTSRLELFYSYYSLNTERPINRQSPLMTKKVVPNIEHVLVPPVRLDTSCIGLICIS